MSDNNAAIRSYLKYYTSLEVEPHFAVLVTGEWGCGKTWFVRDVLANCGGAELKHIYVSLYGVNSFREIENAFFVALHPRLGSKRMGIAAKIVGGAAAVAGSYFLNSGVNGESFGDVARTILTDTGGYILVFDDLERCSIPLDEVLGYINRFVEHDGYKVIIVCNDEKIMSAAERTGQSDHSDIVDRNASQTEIRTRVGEKFMEIKEKTIGKSFRVVPEVESATKSFVAGLDCARTRLFLENNHDVLGEVYLASGYNNLRIVRNAILDFARLFAAMEARYTSNTELQRELLGQFMAYSFEVQVGSVRGDEISRIQFDYLRSLMGKKQPEKSRDRPRQNIAAKYPAQNLESPLVSAEFWKQFFVYGSVNVRQLHHELDSTPYFYDEHTPDWQKIRELWTLSQEVFDALIESVTAGWTAGNFQSVEEVSHVAGILMYLSSQGLCVLSVGEIFEAACEYVNRFRDDGRLLNNVDRWGRVGDADGIGADNSWGNSVPEFGEFLKYRDDQTRIAIERSWPQRAGELLALLTADPVKFQLQLILSNSSENKYGTTVILSYLDTQKFVAAVMKLPRGAWRRIGTTFQERYRALEAAPQLVAEAAWLEELATSLGKLADEHSNTLTGLQIRKLLLTRVDDARNVMAKFIGQKRQEGKSGPDGVVEE